MDNSSQEMIVPDPASDQYSIKEQKNLDVQRPPVCTKFLRYIEKKKKKKLYILFLKFHLI